MSSPEYLSPHLGGIESVPSGIGSRIIREVLLQPIANRSDRVVGHEHLVRLNAPHGRKSTEDVISRLSLADLERLTSDLLLILRVRCLLDCGSSEHVGARHFVNVEKRTLTRSGAVEALMETALELKQSGFQLVVEITERPLGGREKFRDYIDGLIRLKQGGVFIALDDYDIDSPKHWELDLGLCDIVKFDLRTLNLPAEPDENLMAENYRELSDKLYEFIHRYRVELLAEQIETARQFEVVRGLPFKLFQGFYIGRPASL